MDHMSDSEFAGSRRQRASMLSGWCDVSTLLTEKTVDSGDLAKPPKVDEQGPVPPSSDIPPKG